ncbi:MAG: hypothetical protein N2606_04655 [Candidatus Omnitrophica bacterium]|nr:hypothetical protein [Candidatus Omnitrophota bacterium]
MANKKRVILLENIVRFFYDERNQLDIKKINIFLFCILIVVILNFARLVITSAQAISRIDLEKGISLEPPALLSTPKEDSNLPELNNYLPAIKQRNIFRMGKFSQLREETTSGKAQEIKAQYQLVGISWSDDPDALIEDTKLQKTYFVKKGQLVGDMKVEAIYRDRVVLRLGQDLIELK